MISFLMTMTIAHALPVSTETFQLQQLVNNSEKQIESARALLTNSRQSSESLARASRILEDLGAGTQRSIAAFQGTRAYEKALLALQAQPDFVNGQANDPRAGEDQARRKAVETFLEFQEKSVKANLSDLEHQEKMEAALRSAEPGFMPKIIAQTGLASWQSNTRLSSQLTQLLASIQGLREDLRAGGRDPGGLTTLLNGSDMQNEKQREGLSHGRRR